METLLAGLRAAAEPTRLRLLMLCAQNELTVSELTAILGQSQPRVSRHLKLLCEGGLLERFREGNWVFYRLARGGKCIARRLVELVPGTDPTVLRDRARLTEIERDRERGAATYFASNAHQWAAIRSLHVPEQEVEAALMSFINAAGGATDLLDIGTGTGRMLEIFGPKVEHAVGLDLSRDMLAIARVNLERAQLHNCTVRHGDMYALPFAVPSFDLVVLHQVLHFAERPTDVVNEAARVLRPGGRLVIVDFAPHELEILRERHAHRRLGFTDDEVHGWVVETGLETASVVHLPGNPLTVAIWSAHRPLSGARASPDVASRPLQLLGELQS
jgi:SAM-dependent methyltransferase